MRIIIIAFIHRSGPLQKETEDMEDKVSSLLKYKK